MSLHLKNQFDDNPAILIHPNNHLYTVSYKLLDKKSAFPYLRNALSLCQYRI